MKEESKAIVLRKNTLKNRRKFNSERLTKVGSSLRDKFRLRFHSKSFNSTGEDETSSRRTSDSTHSTSSYASGPLPQSAPPLVDKRKFEFNEVDKFRGIKTTWSNDGVNASLVSISVQLNRTVDDISFIWEKGGHIIKDSEGTHIISTRKDSSLHIKDPDQSYLGTYHCIAISFFGNCSTKVTLEEEDIRKSTGKIHFSIDEGVEEMLSRDTGPQKRFYRVPKVERLYPNQKINQIPIDHDDESRVDPFNFWRIHDTLLYKTPQPERTNFIIKKANKITNNNSSPSSPCNENRRTSKESRRDISRINLEKKLLPFYRHQIPFEETDLDLLDADDLKLTTSDDCIESVNRKISVDYESKLISKKIKSNSETTHFGHSRDLDQVELSDDKSNLSCNQQSYSQIKDMFMNTMKNNKNMTKNKNQDDFPTKLVNKTNSSTTISSYSSSDNLTENKLCKSYKIHKNEVSNLASSVESLACDKSQQDSGVVREQLDFNKARSKFFQLDNDPNFIRKPIITGPKKNVEPLKEITPKVIRIHDVSKDAINDTYPASESGSLKENLDQKKDPIASQVKLVEFPTKQVSSKNITVNQREHLKALYQEQCLKEANEDVNEIHQPKEPTSSGPLMITAKNNDPKDDFKITDFLGKGKFGQVQKCIRNSDNKVFAGKFLRSFRLERHTDGNIMEVAILCHIGRHPQIAGIEDIYEFDRLVVIICEYVAGGALYDRILADSDLTECHTIEFVRQILLGLQHLRKCRVIHRDIKPENLMMVDKHGSGLKIIDFGFACFYDPIKPPKLLAGTPTYSAPETLNYDPQHYATDLWSVAVIAYEILSGITPFEIAQTGDPMRELSQQEVINNIVAVRYNFEDEGVSDASDEAKDFIRKILVKKIESRPSIDECLKHPWIAMPEAKRPKVQRTLSLVRRTPGKQSFRNWHDNQGLLELTVKKK